MFKKSRMSLFICITAVLLLNPPAGFAVEVKGVKFTDTLGLDQVELQLTGVATLKWALLFDVYVGAFYLPEGIAGEQWREEIPKCLELSYLRNISAGDFGKSSDTLLRSNLPPAEYEVLSERLQNFYKLFRDVGTGDRYRLIYRPGSGTELWFNQELLGAAPGADFAVAYFGLWLGTQPINEQFRDRLLGAK